MNRRTFLRVLGSAVAVAAVAPASFLAPAGDTVVAATPAWGAGTAGPLTYEMLREAYESCVRGSNHPTMLVTSRSVVDSYARRMGLVFDVEVAA